MNNTQIAVRFDAVKATRIQEAAKRRNMTPPALVQACVDFYLPVIEAGIHGNPFGEPLLVQWVADLEEAKSRLAAATAAPARPLRRTPKAA